MREITRQNRRRKLIKRKILRILSLFSILMTAVMCMITVKIICLKREIENKEETQETYATIEEEKILEEKVEEEKPKPEIESNVTDWNLILVNKDNPIPEKYEFELQKLDNKNQVDTRIVESLNQMLQDAIKNGLDPIICSSYRTNQTQTTLFNNKVKQYKRQGYKEQEAEELASYWVTIPGTSEHEIGLAVDIVSRKYQTLDQKQETTEIQKWLMENCTNYGFILRYPTEKREITKINYEPWHYRYVGIENAKFMKEKGFCLEEFVEYLMRKE